MSNLYIAMRNNYSIEQLYKLIDRYSVYERSTPFLLPLYMKEEYTVGDIIDTADKVIYDLNMRTFYKSRTICY